MKNLKPLSKAEMKKVVGGNFVCGDGYCLEGMICVDGVCAPGDGSSCAWHDEVMVVCRLSKADAIAMQAYNGGNWCCDNCPPGIC